MTFIQLKDLIPKAASKFQLQGEMRAAWVINRAASLVKEMCEENVYRHARVKSFKNGILWIAVNNAAVARELQMISFQFVRKLNQSLGENLVMKLRTFQESNSEHYC